MADIYVRFERGRDNLIGPTYGPYESLQVTYDLLRGQQEKYEEIELAVYRDGDWHLIDAERDETVFSDYVIYSGPYGNGPAGIVTLESFAVSLKVMRILENRGIVKELMPEHDGRGGSIWSWEVLQPERLPDIPWLQANLLLHNGLIRF